VQERWALLSGTQLSTALALAGLFEAERVLQTALVAAALSALANGQYPPLHPQVHKLHRHPAQIEVAAASRALLGESGNAVAQADGKNGTKAHSYRAAPMRMGACLDLLRQAARTLERSANAVTEDPVVVWQTEESVAGIEDCSATTIAADLIAMALREIAALTKQRIAAHPLRTDSAPAEEYSAEASAEHNEEPNALDLAAQFDQQVRDHAVPAGFDAGSIHRLLPMVANAAQLLALEILSAVAPLARGGQAPDHLQDAVRQALDEAIPFADQAVAISAVTLGTAADLVRSGAIVRAAGVELPSVVARRSERTRTL
jgi:histidine ammonia-lyase